MCFQELFFGPYFCQVQDKKWFGITEPIPDGPTTRLMQDLARDTHMVLIVPMYEQEAPGIYYNTAAVIDADGSYLGKYRKSHIPQQPGFWEKYYFRPGNLGYPVFNTAVGKVGVYICYDRHFPEGARVLGLNGAELVFIPSATSRGLSQHSGGSSRPATLSPTATSSARSTASASNPNWATMISTVRAISATRAGSSAGTLATLSTKNWSSAILTSTSIREVRDTWPFYRDRRPEIV